MWIHRYVTYVTNCLSLRVCFGVLFSVSLCAIYWFNREIAFITTVIIHDTRMTRDLFLNSKCTMPVLDPYDKRVIAIVKRQTHLPVDCSRSYTTSITSIISNECLKVDKRILLTHYKTTVECQFKYIRRPFPAQDDDHNVNSTGSNLPLDGECQPLSESDNFVIVECFDQKQKITFINYHIYIGASSIKKIASRTKSLLKNNANPPPNVFLFGLDSTSGSNFIRALPKTRQFLRDTLGVVELKGYNKVADNTFPNLIPFLTGNTYEELTWSVGKYLDRLFFFDSFPLIWKEFSSQGYVTHMAEDAPGIAMFNGGRRGFRKQPVDYYMRPFWIEIENSLLFNMSSDLCLGGVPRHQFLLNWTLQFFRKCQRENVPFFSLLWETEIAHGFPNHLSILDADISHFFQQAHKEGHFNNTVFIMFGDHGSRWGDLRQTQVGKYEDRLPMNVVYLPFWMRRKHSDLFLNLRNNADKLTTHFDTHETLLDLLRIKNSQRYQGDPRKRGISFLRRIPKDRTCAEAGVESHWCACLQHQPISNRSTEASRVSRHLVTHINNIISRFRGPCAVLSLKYIKSIFTMQPNERFLSFTRASWYGQPSFGQKPTLSILDYFITIVTHPGDAMFEATVQIDKEHGSIAVTADISRLNAYKEQAVCTNNPAIRKYCFCKSILK